MLLVGELVTQQMSRSITGGVADTAAASLDIMLADELSEVGPIRPLTRDALRDLDNLFTEANDATVNKLIQIRLHNPDGTILYQSMGGLLDPSTSGKALAAARGGAVTSELAKLELAPIGPLAGAPLPVLKVVTPIHDRASGNVEATAELYFAGGGLIDLEREAEWRVWTSLTAIGLLAIGALFFLVDGAGRTIAAQRKTLATSLEASRRLARENEALRQQANIANEQLLARIGSDLHDGPLQLLALLILNLSQRQLEAHDGDVEVAQQAMEELRSISAGLVLPELTGMSPTETISLAIRRHENVTGASVATSIDALPDNISPDLNVCFYRIVQEGLSNAYIHGLPASASLSARVEDRGLVIEIVNDVADSSASSAASDRPQLGLAGLRARLSSVGGRCEFAIDQEQGRLTAVVPLRS